MHAQEAAALRKLHLFIDALTIFAAMALAAWLQPQLRQWLPFLRDLPSFQDNATLVLLTIPLWLCLLVAFRMHCSFEQYVSQSEQLMGLIKVHALGLSGLALIQFLTQSVINRSVVILFVVCAFFALYFERVLLVVGLRLRRRSDPTRRRILVVGHSGKRMNEFVRDAINRPFPPIVAGYLRPIDNTTGRSVPPPDCVPLECLGDINDMQRVLHEHAIDQVMFFPPTNQPEELREPLALCEQLGIVASFSVSLTQLTRSTPRISTVCGHPFVSFDVAGKRKEWLALKYGLDPIIAALLILLLLPVFVAVALAIAVTMGRPILFIQERNGLNGRKFAMFKFRTMVTDAEQRRVELAVQNEMNGPVFKIKDDPRITPLGRWLRKASLDELPQLFNVLTGAMSLVGPRPLPVSEQRQIRGWQRRRLSMKPGITGLWQVSGRSGLNFDEWMMLDLKYIDDWSLTLDAMLLLRTVPVVLLGRGAH